MSEPSLIAVENFQFPISSQMAEFTELPVQCKWNILAVTVSVKKIKDASQENDSDNADGP